METLVFTVLFASIAAYFATQNNRFIDINFLSYTLHGVPLYLVVLISVLIGLSLSWFISLIGEVSSLFALQDKENKLRRTKQNNVELLKQIHELQVENARLKAKTENEEDNKSL